MIELLFVLPLLVVLAVWPRVERSAQWRLTALLCIVLAGLAHQLLYDTMADDAFISFRYARNLSLGEGFVFNSSERVEGYSNFFLTIALAGLHTLGWPIPETARVIGMVFASLGIVLVYHLTSVITRQATSGLLAALLVAASGSFVAYGPSGLETPLFALLVLAVTYCAVMRRWEWAGVVVSVATMTRPEGILLALPCLAWIILGARTSSERFRNVLAMLLPMTAVLVAWSGWRFWYYGHVLPNPIAAKMGMSLRYQLTQGLLYVISYSVASLPFFALFAFVVWVSIARSGLTWLRGVNLFLAAMLGLLVGFVAGVGGDWMPGWRFLVPAIPIACILLVNLSSEYLFVSPQSLPSARSSIRVTLLGVAAISILLIGFGVASDTMQPWWIPALKSTTVAVVTVGYAVFLSGWQILTRERSSGQRGVVLGYAATAFLLFALSYVHPNLIPRFRVWDQQVKGLAEIGGWLNRTVPSDNWVAQYANGAASYYSDLPTIDVLGLTDEHIARSGVKSATGPPGHNAHDYAYVAKRKPSIVCLSGVGFEKTPRQQIARQEFLADFDAVSFRFPRTENELGQYVNLMILRTKRPEIVARLLSEPGVALMQP